MSTAETNPHAEHTHTNLHPSLLAAVQTDGLDAEKVQVGFRLNQKDQLEILDHHQVYIVAGEKAALWEVPSLRALFRGDKVPPSFAEGPDAEYAPLFWDIERTVLTFCSSFGDKTDDEFADAYGNLRRRPDGKPLSSLQAYLWQVAAWFVGVHPVSAAEFDAIFGRLARSARTFRDGYSSRNYITVLRQMEEDMAAE